MERERFDEVGKGVKREAEIIASVDHQRPARRMISPAAGTLNTTTPCAACKLLRRRCAQECPFSPYFSPHEPHKFASVHKVFGASNVSKLLMEVPEPQRADAANSLVYEATMRLQDPIYGCMSTISALQQQVQLLEAELHAVRAEIMKHKYYKQPAGTEIIHTSTSASLVAPVPAATTSSATLAAASSSSLYNGDPSSTTNTDYNNSTSENIAFFG